MKHFHLYLKLSSFCITFAHNISCCSASTTKPLPSKHNNNNNHHQKCNNYSKHFQKELKGVCVCNSTNCDEISNEYRSLQYNEAILYETNYHDAKRLQPTKFHVITKDTTTSSRKNNTIVIQVKESQKYQTILGFGGAFTDAAAINIYQMNQPTQEQILKSYFSQDGGLEYTLGRIPIASTDFSEYVYSYNNYTDDFNMTHFSIDIDKEPHSHKISLIQRVLHMTNNMTTLFASSWAPPKWMTKENRVENCHLKGYPGKKNHDKYWQALALYYSKFIAAYQNEGIPIWAMTTQNEPIPHSAIVNKRYHWQSLRYKSGQIERDFIKFHLGPTLHKQNQSHVKLIMMDDQRNEIKKWTKATLEDQDAMQYIHGIGIHWYSNIDYMLDPIFWNTGHYQYLDEIHNEHPNLFLLATEACEGYLPAHIGTGSGVHLMEPKIQWQRAENYARDILNDLNHWVVGWTDWNLVLNLQGGPTWAQNFVDAPILVVGGGGGKYDDDDDEFYKQPMYYSLGHFSKFLPPGSQRIHYDVVGPSSLLPSKVQMGVFVVTPANRIVVIVQNRDPKVSYPITIQLDHNRQISFVSTKKSVQTVLVVHKKKNDDIITRKKNDDIITNDNRKTSSHSVSGRLGNLDSNMSSSIKM